MISSTWANATMENATSPLNQQSKSKSAPNLRFVRSAPNLRVHALMDAEMKRRESEAGRRKSDSDTRGEGIFAGTPVPRDMTMLKRLEKARKAREKRNKTRGSSWTNSVVLSLKDYQLHRALLSRHKEVMTEEHCFVGKAAEDRIREMHKTPHEITIYVVGSPQSGKSSIIKSFVQDEYFKKSFRKSRKIYITFDGRPYIFDIHVSPKRKKDTAEERLTSKRVERYRNADVIILCCPVMKHEFELLASQWIPEIREHCPETPIILAGTKVDLRPGFVGYSTEDSVEGLSDELVMEFEYGQDLAGELGLKYVECAAVVGDSGANGVNALFYAAASAAEVSETCSACCQGWDERCTLM